MKSSPAFYIGIFLALGGVLSGCGQPGPLYLPRPPAKAGPFTPAPVPPPPALQVPANPDAIAPIAAPASNNPPAPAR
ncbi:LPS translocon maturation chaperone LptM [Janthinobacterium agaricidamnosum]|uniref:Putative lipoprotein n=1 Tax=Janthinobacterium agaricidamnosum NBRC 102515 = DSM 9628 TaxID=1349767 RepID=W0VDQ6_9BURK|nr:lipoprotein [Janthinobacterium agaricidamnosum]CDG85508.1 putative lipoprotein [Janthinobacterium agaricidamnosum NBRC 102515 = DSM 9628]